MVHCSRGRVFNLAMREGRFCSYQETISAAVDGALVSAGLPNSPAAILSANQTSDSATCHISSRVVLPFTPSLNSNCFSGTAARTLRVVSYSFSIAFRRNPASPSACSGVIMDHYLQREAIIAFRTSQLAAARLAQPAKVGEIRVQSVAIA